MDQVKRAVIAGAGIGGLTAALALAKQGVEVVMCEQSSQLGEVGAGLQISPNASRVLIKLGLADALTSKVFEPAYASIRDYRSGEYYLRAPLGKEAEFRYRAPYWHLHRADLHAVLVEACRSAGVKIQLNAEVSGYRQEQDKVVLLLTDGQSVSGDLLIGADGIRSAVRTQLLGPEKPSFMGQVAWRGVISVDDLAMKIEPEACVWAGPGKHLVTYYLRGGRDVNFVAVEERSDWRSESWREEGDIQQLRRAFADWHPQVTELLGAAKSSFLWSLNGRAELSTWHNKRVVLLGDACHPMLPFMAQGAAMSIEDAYVLADQLSQYDVPIALMNYEAIRKPRATKIQQMSAANAGLYHMHGGVLGKAKLKAMQLATSIAPKIVQSKLDFVYGHDVIG
ncbi:FAD-dependent monooxygenase [Marinomonas aquiplantarum]|uniref:Salicylate hydroxylase n=1 Tax=Marinomonas aquiplantarum TaxID=491951 RepID=A0A366D4A5_9GAMM|nr:FAD-dependent monooxygenase [Marinomonas aquiplantarum]RBO84796.1 salicylate hydroxylase [Marinomonas aquiplantarum]